MLAIAGMQRGDIAECLHSSLPSELCFNVLRDSARRHAKHSVQSPAAMHCLSWKAASLHNMGCKSLEVADLDWSTPLKAKSVKSTVHNSTRCTDKSLGISSEGLTRHRVNKWYTKPHIWCQRLHLLRVLSQIYTHELEGDVEQRTDAIMKMHDNMWLSKLVPEMWLMKDPQHDGSDLPEHTLLVSCSGPYTVACVKLSLQEGGAYVLEKNPRTWMVVDTLERVKVAQAKASVETWGLGWQKTSEWMTLPEWVADYGILTISATLLSALVAKMKLKFGRLDHKHRVELFLRHMKKDEEYIQTVMGLLPEPKVRKRQKPDGEKQFEQEI